VAEAGISIHEGRCKFRLDQLLDCTTQLQSQSAIPMYIQGTGSALSVPATAALIWVWFDVADVRLIK